MMMSAIPAGVATLEDCSCRDGASVEVGASVGVGVGGVGVGCGEGVGVGTGAAMQRSINSSVAMTRATTR